jgi:hypothetical protein
MTPNHGKLQIVYPQSNIMTPCAHECRKTKKFVLAFYVRVVPYHSHIKRTKDATVRDLLKIYFNGLSQSQLQTVIHVFPFYDGHCHHHDHLGRKASNQTH